MTEHPLSGLTTKSHGDLVLASDLPDPLVPAEVDLREFEYMALDVRRLRDSKFASQPSAEAFRAGLLLWCAAWHQVPAASLPNDDEELSQLSGFGRVVKEWRKVKAGAMHRWVLCSDGRWYHPIIAEKALIAWQGKLVHQHGKLLDRLRKENRRREANGEPAIEVPTFDAWISAGKPEFSNGKLGPPPPDAKTIPPEKPEVPPDFQRISSLKGEGEVKVKGENFKSFLAGAIAPDATREKKAHKPVDNSRPRPRHKRVNGHPVDRWRHSEKASVEKGKSLGLEPRAGESMEHFRERIQQRIEQEQHR